MDDSPTLTWMTGIKSMRSRDSKFLEDRWNDDIRCRSGRSVDHGQGFLKRQFDHSAGGVRSIGDSEDPLNGRSAAIPGGSEAPKLRRLAQHYLNGLRISAFLIRHGFNKMRVTHVVGLYEKWVYPILYQSCQQILNKKV